MMMILFIVVIIVYFIYNRFYNYYSYGDSDSFEVKVNETFEIRLGENPSTGYSNCWLNEYQIKSLKLINQKYQSSLSNTEGANGIVTLTFKAINKGIDTIKIANCPVAAENKNCSDFTEKNTEVGTQFIIIITEN